MSQIYKGVVWTIVITVAGYGLMKAFSPSENEIREKLRHADKAEIRQRNKDIMAVLKQSAGIEDKNTNDLKKK